jgi:hypothetical protein
LVGGREVLLGVGVGVREREGEGGIEVEVEGAWGRVQAED